MDEEDGPADPDVDVADNPGVRLDELAPRVIFAMGHLHVRIEAATCTGHITTMSDYADNRRWHR
jgi:hypothetical protein